MAINNRGEKVMWLSQCCYAHPLFDLHYENEDDEDVIGICSHCRDNTTFINEEEE